MIRPLISALGFSAALVCAMPALAQDVVSIHVGYGDLNLANTAGEAVFERRIDAAVTEICGRSPQRDLNQVAIVSQCRREASAGAREMARRAIAAARGPVMAATGQPVLVAIR